MAPWWPVALLLSAASVDRSLCARLPSQPDAGPQQPDRHPDHEERYGSLPVVPAVAYNPCDPYYGIFRPIPPPSAPLTTLKELGPYGGMGGRRSFSDAEFQNRPVTGFLVRAGDRIDVLQLRYGDRWGDSHGRGHDAWGIKQHIKILEEGEKIVGVFGTHGGDLNSLDQIGFYTDRRHFGLYGRKAGRTKFDIHLGKEGCELAYISGRAGYEVDRLWAKFKCPAAA